MRLLEEAVLVHARIISLPGVLTPCCMAAPGEEAHLWGSGGLNGAVMSEAERAAYEEKKLKMRKAMGENLGDDVEGESISMKQRRCRLMHVIDHLT